MSAKAPHDLEAEALRRVELARQGQRVTLTGKQAISLQDFYRKLLDERAKCGLVLEGNHP